MKKYTITIYYILLGWTEWVKLQFAMRNITFHGIHVQNQANFQYWILNFTPTQILGGIHSWFIGEDWTLLSEKSCVVFHLPLSQHFFLTSDAMISNFSINHIKCQITSVLSSVSCSLVSVRKSYACTQMDPFWSEYS